MSYNTVISQGRFTSTGASKTIEIRSDFDWIRVYNMSALALGAADEGVEFYFQRGMTNGSGVVYTKLGTVANDPLTIGALAANTGFTTLDSSGNPLSNSVAITAGTDLTEPVYSTASTAGLVTGSIVRVTGLTGQESMSGYDFAVDTIIANTSFKIAAPVGTTPGAAATAGSYRIIKFDPIFYPRHRYIVNITQAAQAVLTLSVPSGYSVGQEVRVFVDDAMQSGVSVWGMQEINGLIGTVTAVVDTVGTQTVTLDIDSSGFSAFTFPTAAKAQVKALRKAMVVPVGIDTATAIAQSVNLLSDATDNRGFIGVSLAGGAVSPAGENADVIYWSAGKSFSVDNQ